MAQSLARITKKRELKREDVINGEKLSRVEWMWARKDHKELVKIYAMNTYVLHRQAGMASRQAYEEAAKIATTPLGGHVNWQTVRIWLGRFIEHGSKIRFDQRGRNTKTKSFLDDQNVKAQALEWLREQLRMLRAKNVDTPALTVSTFCTWVNGTLLKAKLDADDSLSPIKLRTASNWLHSLGFKYKSHSKSIYFDGHEREDVTRDRSEKLVMAKVLEEVTVWFDGENCEIVVWPLLHPGEPPVVWVSQDECAYHSNDDVKSEWAEEGKGLQIKQKSRGSLLMVSAFLSELHGVLRCTTAERDAYISKHPSSAMAAKLAANPGWSGSSTIMIEPGAAPGKDRYFDAEQLMDQTKVAMDVFDATHITPGRWVYHPTNPAHGAKYPLVHSKVWLPPTPCKAMIFYDHSSGHGAYSKDALLASHGNKGPDWKGSVEPMRDGWFYDSAGARQIQKMQFDADECLACDIRIPTGIDPAATQAAAAAAEEPSPEAALPPDAAEIESAFKLFTQGTLQTLRKHNPGKSTADLQSISRDKWDKLSADRQRVYVDRRRKKAAAAQQPEIDRVIKAGQPVPPVLLGRNKGLEIILRERGLYPAAGLKGACANAKSHSETNDCCCAKMLSVQPDFAAECSALQHLVETRIQMPGALMSMTTLRHLCYFLPKFHCELNWIERCWGASKQYARSHCLYTLQGLRETVPLSLSQDLSDLPSHLSDREDLPVCPLYVQRRWARITRRYMIEYRKGVDACDAIKAVKAQSSKRHRDTNDPRSRQIEAAMAKMAKV